MAISNDEMDQITQRVVYGLRHEYVDHFDNMSAEEHREHHIWIETEIAEKKTRIARNEEVRRHIMKWGIVGVLGFVITAAWHYITRGNHGA